MRDYYVYILASPSRTLYVGVTNDLQRRVHEHRNGTGSQFTRRYNVTRLVYYETTQDSLTAIQREKTLKTWLRARKIALIEAANPAWDDLAADW